MKSISMRNIRRLVKPAASQHGVALVVVLIFLLALSTLAIFSSRNATLSERQARNELEYQVARQAAEAALRDAEKDLAAADGSVVAPGAICATARGGAFRSDDVTAPGSEFTNACTRGQCLGDTARYAVDWKAATTSNPGQPWWPDSKGGSWNNTFSSKPSRSSGAVNCGTFTGAVSLGVFTGTPALPGVVRQPEYLIEYIRPSQDLGFENSNFTCPTPVMTGTDAGFASADAIGSAGAQVQNMPCHLFRITARGFGSTTRGIGAIPSTEVLLQTYFHVIKP